jgi:2-polyprenyl-6-methoxyphenol hydroxylase-like FAD-dependent oxidoreductase
VSGTRVLVAGASIAGPALAHWLHRRGAEVTVVERAPGLRPGGQAVDARGVASALAMNVDRVRHAAVGPPLRRGFKISLVSTLLSRSNVGSGWRNRYEHDG